MEKEHLESQRMGHKVSWYEMEGSVHAAYTDWFDLPEPAEAHTPWREKDAITERERKRNRVTRGLASSKPEQSIMTKHRESTFHKIRLSKIIYIADGY